MQFVILSALVGQALLGMLLAWLIQSVPKGVKTFTETAVIAAWILPEVVIGFAWFAFLDYDNGTLNMILNAVGPAAPATGCCSIPSGSSSSSTPGAAPPSR